MPSLLSTLPCFPAPFRDKRLNQRLQSLLPLALAATSASLIQIAGSKASAQHKALSRFLANSRCHLHSLRSALYRFSYLNAQRHKLQTLLVVHDPSFLSYTRHPSKKLRLSFHKNGRENGYCWLNAALIDPESGRFLGVANNTLVDSQGPDDRSWINYAPRIKDPDRRQEFINNPNQQFLTHVRTIDKEAPQELKLIHVADSEFDDSFAFRAFDRCSKRNHYVIRSRGQRVLQLRPASWIPRKEDRSPLSLQKWVKGSLKRRRRLLELHMKDLLKHIPFGDFRTIALNKFGRPCPKGFKVAHYAKLEVAAVAVRLAKKSDRGQRAKAKEQAIWVNMVVVREKDPEPGKQGLQWILITDLPIESFSDIEFIVEAYIRRWRIEEFFRTCKQTMKLEDSRLRDPRALARLLCLLVVRQMHLDDLRKTAEIRVGKPVSETNRLALKRALKRARRIEKKVREKGAVEKFSEKQGALMELALLCEYGGWGNVKGNHLGNQVLTRGQIGLKALQGEGSYTWLVREKDP